MWFIYYYGIAPNFTFNLNVRYENIFFLHTIGHLSVSTPTSYSRSPRIHSPEYYLRYTFYSKILEQHCKVGHGHFLSHFFWLIIHSLPHISSRLSVIYADDEVLINKLIKCMLRRSAILLIYSDSKWFAVAHAWPIRQSRRFIRFMVYHRHSDPIIP
jgi:hypothetical protein